MDEKSLGSLLSQIISDQTEKDAEPGETVSEVREGILVESLQAMAGASGGDIEQEVDAFLRGEGELLETTRTAVTRGRSSAKSDVADFLKRQFHLSAPVAGVVAGLLVQLFPAIGKLADAASPEKPKPRRKKKAESSSKPKKPKSASGTKPKKPKSSSSTKPASSAKPKKPKTSSSTKPSASSKPKKRKASSGAKRVSDDGLAN